MAASQVSTETNDDTKPNIKDQSNGNVSNGSGDDSAFCKRVSSAGSTTTVCGTLVDFENNFESENGDDAFCSVVESKTKINHQEAHLHEKPEDSKKLDDFMAGKDVELNFDMFSETSQSSLYTNNTVQESNCVRNGRKMTENAFSANENELRDAGVMPGNESVSEELNIPSITGQSDSSEIKKQTESFKSDKEAIETKDATDKQNVMSEKESIITRENFNQRPAADMSKTSGKNGKSSGERNLMSKLFESGKKLSSANNSPRLTRKSENSSKTSDEFGKDSESSLAANFKKNIKNRFADVQIRFRKNEDSVNASEVEWQADDSEGVPEPTRSDVGKRNILAAAQERGRAFIPELKNKFSGLSNRSPRLDRKKDWEKVIEESNCRTKIILI